MKKTLVILAAGMGSRFGGLKQIEPMGPNGEFIIDYSIYDALKEGFEKVVFLIKEENYEIFKETIGSRVEPHVEVEYVFQKIDDVPEGVVVPEGRVKPWGTAHAIYAVRNAVDGPFLVINADDFYGREGYHDASVFLDNMNEKEYATIGYKVTNTMTENGSVKRGFITMNGDKLDYLTESKIERNENGEIIAEPLDGSDKFIVSEDAMVSMNLLAFDMSIFDYLEKEMVDFFNKNKENLESCEFLIPDVMTKANNDGYATVKAIPTESVWYGVTYREDTDNVKTSLKKLVEEGKYPNNLWEE